MSPWHSHGMQHDDAARDDAPHVISVRRLAAMADYHPGSIRRLIQERRSIGAFAVRVGPHWRFKREDVDRWLRGEIDGQQEAG